MKKNVLIVNILSPKNHYHKHQSPKKPESSPEKNVLVGGYPGKNSSSEITQHRFNITENTDMRFAVRERTEESSKYNSRP